MSCSGRLLKVLKTLSCSQENMECDFKGGAGATCDKKPVASKPITEHGEVQSPKCELKEDSSDSKNNSKVFTELTPTRHSARMAGKTFK